MVQYSERRTASCNTYPKTLTTGDYLLGTSTVDLVLGTASVETSAISKNGICVFVCTFGDFFCLESYAYKAVAGECSCQAMLLV